MEKLHARQRVISLKMLCSKSGYSQKKGTHCMQKTHLFVAPLKR